MIEEGGRTDTAESAVPGCVTSGNCSGVAPTKLELSEDQYQTLFELAPDPIYLNDLNGTFLEGNRAAEELTGYSKHELIGKSWLQTNLLAPSDLERAAKNLVTLANGEPTGPAEYLLHSRTGEQVPLEIRALPLEIGGQQVVMGVARDIRERKQAEAALRESERQLATLMSNLPGMAYRCRHDHDWTMEFVSDGAYTLTGYEAADLVENRKVSYAGLIHPEDREDVQRQVRRAVERREPFVMNYRLFTAGGELRWVWEQGRGVFDDQGRVQALEGFVADKTSRKMAEQHLARDEARFRCLSNVLQYDRESTQEFLSLTLEEALRLSGSKLGYIHFYAQDLKSRSANRCSEEMPAECAVSTPLSGQELAKTGFWEEAVRQRRQPVIVNSLAAAHPLRDRYPGDGVRPHRFMALPVLLDDRVVAVAGVANKDTDYDQADLADLQLLMDAVWRVVQKRRATEALVASEEHLRRAVVDSPFPTMLHAEDGTVLHVSNSWCEISGFRRDELPTTVAWTCLAYGADAQRVQVGVDRLYRLDQRLQEGEFSIRTRSGDTRIWEFSSAPLGLLPDGRRLVISVANDVTETRRLEAQRVVMEAQMRRQQKLESIGTLAGGVAHEINNPINGILNYAQLIQDRLPAGSPLHEFTNEILRETQRVTGIVRNLLTFARDEKQSHSPARLLDIVESTLSLVRTVIRHDRIALTIDVSPELPLLRCRSQQLQQVLMNLMTNARDALNERYPGYHQDKVLRVAAHVLATNGAPRLRLTVEDHGSGIPQELRERVFDPFFTTKPRDRGTGLGLSISHGIVQDHSGELWFESEPGHGTRFHVDLPLEPFPASSVASSGDETVQTKSRA